MTYTDPAVQVHGLTKRYGDVAVLDGVDLAVDRGSVFALLGPNGAGKTTTVRILATLSSPDAGTVRVAGYDVRTERKDVRRRISLTGQSVAVDDVQTGRENLVMTARLRGLDRAAARRRATELLESFDLVDLADRRVGTYSGGLRRRLDLALALVADPDVLFLDEPTTGLDPRSRAQVWASVRDLARRGTTVVLTTQYLEEADTLADRIAVLSGGLIAAEGSAAELKRAVGEQRLCLETTGDHAFDVVLARLAGSAAAADPTTPTDRAVASDRTAHRVEVRTDGSAAHLRAVLDRVDPDGDLVATVTVRTPTLDDAFLALTGAAPVPSDLVPTDLEEAPRV